MIKNKHCTIQIKSNSLLSCLSISTMCLLVFTSIVIITVISLTPIIILGLGQISAGQRDIILHPASSGTLNTTKIAQLTGSIPLPRYSSLIILNGQSGVGWFMDLNKEQQNHLGTLPISHNLQSGEQPVYLHSQFGVTEGSFVEIEILISEKLYDIRKIVLGDTNIEKSEKIIGDINYLLSLDTPLSAKFKVAGTFDISLGKFPVGSVGGYAYFDINTAQKHLIKSTLIKNSRNQSQLINFLQSNKYNPSDYAKQITINIPNRIKVYSNSDYQQTYDTLSMFGSQILRKIGIFSATSSIPIASNLIQMSYFGMFIGVILKLIIISLFVLSTIMMNNMMMLGTDRKSFDFALLKTMGANKTFVILNLIFSSAKHVIIANVVAFPFAYLILGFISGIFKNFFGYSYDVKPTLSSILGGIFIGVLVPIVSSIAPIWGIIKNDLVQNLNPIRNKTEAIHTQIYIEGQQFPIGKLTFGVIASLFGLMIYYLLPKGLINQDVGLLLFVFFSILIGLLLGLILLSYSIQYAFEKMIAYLTLFWVNKTDFMLTLKNMSAHRFKNRRSSLLYALSVATIIFVSVGISIQLQTIKQYSLSKHGAFIQIHSSAGFINKKFYDQIFRQNFQEDVIDWAYQTRSMSSVMLFESQVMKVQFSDKARIFFATMNTYGVSPNFGKVYQQVSGGNYQIVKTYARSPYDPYQHLYTPEGYMTCIISQFAGNKFGLIDSDNKQFLMTAYKMGQIQKVKLNVSTIFTQQAGLSYSRFDFGKHQVAVSLDTYTKLAGIKSYSQIPYAYVKLHVRDKDSTAQLANRLRKVMSTKNTDQLWEYSESRQTIDKIENLLKNILRILLVMVLLISFFSLITTSYINIINQSTQIGILLTLGYTKSRIVRIFIYQSFVLVLNSCIIGVVVGIFVAWMMGLQRQLFADFPVSIEIDGIWIIAIAAIVSSILSIIKPIRQLFSQSINQIFMYS